MDCESKIFINGYCTDCGRASHRDIEPDSKGDRDVRIKELEEKLESAQFCGDWLSVRLERLQDLLKPTPLWPEAAAIIANGTATTSENPTYAQTLSLLRIQVEELETDKKNLLKDLMSCERRFRLSRKSPNDLLARVEELKAELERVAEQRRDMARDHQEAARIWQAERCRLRGALERVTRETDRGPLLTDGSIVQCREALALVAGVEHIPTEGERKGDSEYKASDAAAKLTTLFEAGSKLFPDSKHVSPEDARFLREMQPKPDPTAARLVCSDEIRGLVEWVNGMEIREARELRRLWEARAEYAALLKVAEAALDYWVHETKTNRERLHAALAELRRARGNGESDGQS